MAITSTIRDISELTPAAQKACTLFLQKCGDAGLPVLITETYRTQARQNYLYEQGRTRPGKIVTWTKNSRHTGRRAWDIAKNIKGQEYSDSGFFSACGKIAGELNIIWGGNWKTPDTPHFEIATTWTVPNDYLKEEQEMEELKARIAALEARVKILENPMIYNYIDSNLPDWAAETVRELVEQGILKGDMDGLRLDENMLRTLVIVRRMLQK